MLFNSWQYALFLPAVFLIYWALPHRFRWVLILLSSYFFYISWKADYIILILFTTAATFLSALLIENSSKPAVKKLCVVFSVVISIGMLFLFKYFNFFSESVCALLKCFSIDFSPYTIQLILPIGVSFYTFQSLGYVIDVYRGKVRAERHFGYFAAFVSFFPLLGAGPIERANSLLPQIKGEHSFDYKQAAYGLKLMAWGYFKKIVVADNLAVYVDMVYDDVFMYSGFSLVLAVIFFTIQIYCDFSGYSDIARGTAKLMGIEITENFRSPYFSTTIKQFWSRWHISLSTWFRDYLYIPLGGNRKGSIRKYLNLMITFVVSGLWHGASFTFIIWGALHGLLQVVEYILHIKAEESRGIRRVLRVMCVFVIVSLAWVFFRAHSVNEAVYVFKHLFDGISSPVSYCLSGFTELGFGRLDLLVCVMFYLAPLAVFDRTSLEKDVISAVGELQPVLRWILYSAFTAMVAMLFYSSMNPSFIYFQF